MKLIMFDMDGTLLNSGAAIVNTINYVRDNIGLEQMEKSHVLKHINDPDINSAKFFYGTEEFTQEQNVLFNEYYNKNCLNDIVLYDGIKELIESLNKNCKLAVATNASSIFAKRMLIHLDLHHHFDMLVGYNDVENPKPHPEMIYKIMNQLNASKDKAILIGDSKKDTQAATNAGIDSILVNWGFSDYEDEALDNVTQLSEILL
ncbi:HAD family hydrolase [Arcobacter sp. 31_11_sub10_T18]|nr:HAD family hydrolase [Arcobacter sp. 31_11_sub10_T18]